jgi:cytochrome P450
MIRAEQHRDHVTETVVEPVIETDFDHGTLDFVLDRPAGFRTLREQCPVVHSSAYDGFYALTSWAAVQSAATNGTVFSSQPRALIPMYPEPLGMLDLDPPQGPQVRRCLNPLFDKASAEKTRARIREVIDQRIDAFIERGSADLIRELTAPLVATITAEGVGLPVERADDYAEIFHDLLSAPESEQEMNAVLARLGGFLDELRGYITERRADLRDDWLSALITLEVDGRRMDDEEVLQNAHLLFSGGVDTTSGAMAWALVHLHSDHELRERLRLDPSLLPTAVDEFLRFHPPFICSARTVTQDTQLAGVQLNAGKRAMLAWAAGNRDPEVFHNPDEFIPDRHPNRHLAFGAGNHKCLGQHFARVQMEEIISAVITRIPDYAVDESRIDRYVAHIVNGMKFLPVTFTPGQRGT